MTYILNFWCEVMKAQRPPYFPKWKAPVMFSSIRKPQEEQALTSTNMLFQLSNAPSFRKTSIMVITKNMSYSWKDTRRIKHLTFNTQPPTRPGWVCVWQCVHLCLTTRTPVCVSWFFRKGDWSTVCLAQHDSNLGWYCLSISPAVGSMKYNPPHCPMPQVLTGDNKWTFAEPNSHCPTGTKSILALPFTTGTHYTHSRTTGWAVICFIASATHPVSEGKISLNCLCY